MAASSSAGGAYQPSGEVPSGVAVKLEVGVGRRGPVGEHHVEPVQGQVGQQVFEVALVAHQAQARLGQRGRQQLAHRELGQPIGNAHHQPHTALAGGVAHGGVQLLAQMKDLLGHLQRRLTGLGQHQAAPGWLEQRVTQRLLQQTHLRAHRLHRHAQAGRRVRHAAFLGRYPKVIQMLVVEILAHAHF